MIHRCHAIACDEVVERRFLMCKKHWQMVPIEVRDKLVLAYRPGQVRDKRPSKDWLFAAKEAINEVFAKECPD